MMTLPYRRFAALVFVGVVVVLSNFLFSLGTTYGTFDNLSRTLVGSRTLLKSSVHFSNERESSSVSNYVANYHRDKEIPTIFMVTPTYRRAEQIPELTRTCQTLKLVKNLVWIIVEDASETSQEVVDYLQKCGTPFVYMRAQMPKKFEKKKNKPRGVSNRNAGIEYVRSNAQEGVLYFGDDDNTYDVQIFEEIRWTKGVSMFPVGLVTQYSLSTPVVRDGIVIGFYDGWIANRKFPVDMAGFAVNLNLVKKYSNCSMPFTVGYEEDGFLKCLNIKMSDIEPKAKNCTEILVWHTQTKKNKPARYDDNKMKLPGTNLITLKKKLWKGS